MPAPYPRGAVGLAAVATPRRPASAREPIGLVVAVGPPPGKFDPPIAWAVMAMIGTWPVLLAIGWRRSAWPFTSGTASGPYDTEGGRAT
jgi:hypothetical protein